MSEHVRLLVAGEEEPFVARTAQRLRQEGFDVDTVSGQPERLAAVRGDYDLLLSDQDVPGAERVSRIPIAEPVDFEELLPRIRTAISRSRTAQTLRGMEVRLAEWREEVGRIATSPDSVDAFLALTVRNVMGSLTDLVTLNRSLRGEAVPSLSCQAMNCAHGLQLRAALKETIDVLEQTKSAFKSKTLANLRQKLELLLQDG